MSGAAYQPPPGPPGHPLASHILAAVSEGTPEPRILARSEHPISRKDISPHALKVLYRLHQRGFKAHMVGGSVRDLMLGRRPKDFDVATEDRKSTRLNSSHLVISYAVFCLKKKTKH